MISSILMFLTLNFTFTQNWEINPSDYELQMTMTGVLSINNEFSQSDDYFIGAFVGDVCRGFASSINVFENSSDSTIFEYSIGDI